MASVRMEITEHLVMKVAQGVSFVVGNRPGSQSLPNHQGENEVHRELGSKSQKQWRATTKHQTLKLKERYVAGWETGWRKRQKRENDQEHVYGQQVLL